MTQSAQVASEEPVAGPSAGSAGQIAPPLRRSAWTTGQKIRRLIWDTFGRVVWAVAPGLRSTLIRAFGGSVGSKCRFARSVEITIPWNVHVGDNVQVGERVLLYGLGPITIGSDVVIDFKAHLCAGTHDMTDSRFPLLRPPINIGSRCFIGIDAYVGPDVTLGDDVLVHPRASVYKSFPDGSVELTGNPAKPVSRDREEG